MDKEPACCPCGPGHWVCGAHTHQEERDTEKAKREASLCRVLRVLVRLVSREGAVPIRNWDGPTLAVLDVS